MQKIEMSDDLFNLLRECPVYEISEKVYYLRYPNRLSPQQFVDMFPNGIPKTDADFFDMAKDTDKEGQFSFLPNNRKSKILTAEMTKNFKLWENAYYSASFACDIACNRYTNDELTYSEYERFGDEFREVRNVYSELKYEYEREGKFYECTNIRMSGKPAKVLRRMLGDNISSNAYEAFAAYIAKKFTSLKRENWAFSIVSGEDIRTQYNEENYVIKPENSSGNNLYGSCMRHDECQKYLDIYVKNTEQIALAVATYKGQTVARSLVWKKVNGLTQTGKMIDGLNDVVYSINSDASNYLLTHLENLCIEPASRYVRSYNLSVTLPYWKQRYYPFIDTFRYGMGDEFFACDSNSHDRIYNSTGGGYQDVEIEEECNTYCCDSCGNETDEEDLTSVHRRSGMFCDSCAARCEETGRIYLTEDMCYSSHYGGYIHQDYAYYVESESDYFKSEDVVNDYNGDDILMDDSEELCEESKYSGEHAHKDECRYLDYDGTEGYVLKDEYEEILERLQTEAAEAESEAAEAAEEIRQSEAAEAESEANFFIPLSEAAEAESEAKNNQENE